MKWTRQSTIGDAFAVKKRIIAHSTFEKWKRHFDCEFKTVTWLACESTVEGGAKVVTKLKCTVCSRFHSSILYMRNFSDKWITGVDSIRTSNIWDHATSEQHSHAMTMLSREQATASGHSVMADGPIVVAFNSMSNEERERVRHKFDIAYVLAMEKISFHNFPSFCQLEARLGVIIGSSYTTETVARSFIHFIAETKRNKLTLSLQQGKFFSLLLDGSTDSRNIENEIMVVV